MEFDISTREELAVVAREVATRIQGRRFSVILLEGNLGAGKTTFSQEIGRTLGTEGLQSPTYSILNVHDLPDGQMLYHLDLYRTESREEMDIAGISELFLAGEGIFLVEWPRFMDGLLEGAIVLHCKLELQSDGKRLLTLS